MNKIYKVSILLPTYNGSNRISKAINSVLSQTYKNIELIVIDDGSTDSTQNIVEDLAKTDERIKYIKNSKNLGLQKTLNKGLSLSTGSLIARIDDDDFWNDQKKLDSQVKFFEKNNDYVLVGTGMHAVDENGKKVYDLNPPETDTSIRKNILFRTSFIHSSVCFKKQEALNCGGYNESLQTRHVEDHDLWLNLGKQGKMYNLQIPSVTIIFRNDSVSGKNLFDQQLKELKLINKYKKNYPNYLKALIQSLIKIFYRLILRKR